MRVHDLLGHKSSSLITVEPKTPIEAAVRLLIDNNIGGLPVVAADGTPVGFIAERDVVRAVREHPVGLGDLHVEHIMRPAAICEADDALEDVMRRMTAQRLRHLLVRDGGRTVGVISVGDIVKHRLEQLETETGVLRDYVAAQRVSRY